MKVGHHNSSRCCYVDNLVPNIAIAEYLSFADQVLVLSNGNLRKEEAHERKLPQPISFPATADEIDDREKYREPAIKDTAAQLSQTNQISDLKRATGDFAVYKYYLRYIGWSKITAFLIFVTVHVFCSTYSRKSALLF